MLQSLLLSLRPRGVLSGGRGLLVFQEHNDQKLLPLHRVQSNPSWHFLSYSVRVFENPETVLDLLLGGRRLSPIQKPQLTLFFLVSFYFPFCFIKKAPSGEPRTSRFSSVGLQFGLIFIYSIIITLFMLLSLTLLLNTNMSRVLFHLLKMFAEVADGKFPVSVCLFVRVKDVFGVKYLFENSKMRHGIFIVLLTQPGSTSHTVVVLSTH